MKVNKFDIFLSWLGLLVILFAIAIFGLSFFVESMKIFHSDLGTSRRLIWLIGIGVFIILIPEFRPKSK